MQEEAKRVVRAADTTAEVNILDSVNMPLNDPNICKLIYLCSGGWLSDESGSHLSCEMIYHDE